MMWNFSLCSNASNDLHSVNLYLNWKRIPPATCRPNETHVWVLYTSLWNETSTHNVPVFQTQRESHCSCHRLMGWSISWRDDRSSPWHLMLPLNAKTWRVSTLCHRAAVCTPATHNRRNSRMILCHSPGRPKLQADKPNVSVSWQTSAGRKISMRQRNTRTRNMGVSAVKVERGRLVLMREEILSTMWSQPSWHQENLTSTDTLKMKLRLIKNRDASYRLCALLLLAEF